MPISEIESTDLRHRWHRQRFLIDVYYRSKKLSLVSDFYCLPAAL